MKKILFLLGFALFFSSCEQFAMDVWYGIDFYNHTNNNVVVVCSFVSDSIIDDELSVKADYSTTIYSHKKDYKKFEKKINNENDTLLLIVVTDSTYKKERNLWIKSNDVSYPLKQFCINKSNVGNYTKGIENGRGIHFYGK